MRAAAPRVRQSLHAATQFRVEFETSRPLLVAHPAIGRPIEGMKPAFRDWPIAFGDSGYVVRDRQDVKLVLILAVRHANEAGF